MADKKIVIISGYFNPVHVGHLDYIATAKSLGDELWVIVNTDEQVELKGSVPFQNETDRLKIVQYLKPVDYAVLSSDKDSTVINTLKTLHSILHTTSELIFANGGDRLQGNTPEELFCEQNNIKTIYGVGGRKVQSSSDLIEKASIFNIGEENVK
jgi:D-beta-D-heptose 7-phosphate kinase/D-beta-D-heptose 1-phosphate adenosyltransferase|tara:strand:+ start:8789 stop:9253 length:465 start_codon:yes stop_codon:yes gene_type:complete